MYKCICGREFDNPQSFNGHKTHCKIHQVTTYGEEHYSRNQSLQRRTSSAGGDAIKRKCDDKKHQSLLKWVSEQHTCEHCGKIMTTKFGSGRFCNRSCANAKVVSESHRKKTSNTLLSHYHSAPNKCSLCGKILKRKTVTGLCRDCLNHSPEGFAIRSSAGRSTQYNLLAQGIHKGWKSRNIKSYAESFWEKVLTNNGIDYEREKSVKTKNSRYFLDFVIYKNGCSIDLEIDGKQHLYKDRVASDLIRDNELSDMGFIVYRVPWNEIKTTNGKNLMRDKINEFIKYYENIGKYEVNTAHC